MNTIAQQFIQQGIQEGQRQGEEKGRIGEAQRMLLRILYRRFGQVPEDVEKRIRAASLDLVEVWIDASIDAVAITDIFGKTDSTKN